ncbi:RNase A-like domain-containing protein [Methylobacterium trifolii]|uniref:RNase A-like domain-containing protein n=1 Tax=Methylobacterium trifolii TaxID=1003092 RepID=UPI0024B59B66|nr:RNase A-like domain-containing protein [Methylobacterium trifolii]
MRHHVGKTDDEMRQRVQENMYRTRFFTIGFRRSGSFPSMESANDLTNRTLEQNRDIVDQVASGTRDAAFVERRFGYATGREAYSTEDGVLYMRNTYGVGVRILHDPRSPRGYRVYTSDPRKDGD